MNPELLRNLWIEVTPLRLVAVPAVLALILAAAGLAEGTGAISGLAWWLGLLIGIVLGARQAAGAVMGEVAARTWDGQRASALTPLAMTVGKLAGATAMAWYGVALCLAVHLGFGGTPSDAARLVLRTGLSHAAALFASLVLLSLGGRAPVTTSLPHLAGIAAGAGLEQPFAWMAEASGWYGLAVEGDGFALSSAALFWSCAAAGAVRLMARELSVPQRPLAWPGFVLVAAAYAAGFGWADGIGAMLGLAFVAAAISVAAAALAEPRSRREIARLLGGDAGAAPPSIQALAIAAVLAAALQLRPPPMVADLGTLLPVAVLLFLARDIALVRLLSLRRGGLRGSLAAIVCLAVLYVVLPTLLASAGATGALVLLMPIPAEGASPATALAFGAPGAQALLAWSLLAKRVGRGSGAPPEPPLTPPRPAARSPWRRLPG